MFQNEVMFCTYINLWDIAKEYPQTTERLERSPDNSWEGSTVTFRQCSPIRKCQYGTFFSSSFQFFMK